MYYINTHHTQSKYNRIKPPALGVRLHYYKKQLLSHLSPRTVTYHDPVSFSTCIIYILDVQNLSPTRIPARYIILSLSSFALLEGDGKNRNRNTNPDDGRDRHPVNQFRRGDVPDRVHFFRVDVFCFFLRARATTTNERRERERVSQERERDRQRSHVPG